MHEKGELSRQQEAFTNTAILRFDIIHAELHEIKQLIIHMEKKMSQEMDDLQAEVTKTRGVVNSAVTLIQGLRQAIIDAGTDPAKLKALTDELATDNADLAAAVATPGTA